MITYLLDPGPFGLRPEWASKRTFHLFFILFLLLFFLLLHNRPCSSSSFVPPVIALYFYSIDLDTLGRFDLFAAFSSFRDAARF